MTTANPNLIAVGDNCLDAYLSKGFVTVGGNALNVAVQWRRHGLNARYFGALGPDAEADIMLAAIEEAGLDRNDVEIRPGASAVTLLTDDAGERRFLLESLGVGENYVPDADRYKALRQADWVHLGTNSSETLVGRLIADGVAFSIDVSTRHFDLSLDGVPLVFASGPDDPAEPVEPLIAQFRAAGARQVVVTCGKRGSFYHDGTALSAAGSVPVAVVDTCGAGGVDDVGLDVRDVAEGANRSKPGVRFHRGYGLQRAKPGAVQIEDHESRPFFADTREHHLRVALEIGFGPNRLRSS